MCKLVYNTLHQHPAGKKRACFWIFVLDAFFLPPLSFYSSSPSVLSDAEKSSFPATSTKICWSQRTFQASSVRLLLQNNSENVCVSYSIVSQCMYILPYWASPRRPKEAPVMRIAIDDYEREMFHEGIWYWAYRHSQRSSLLAQTKLVMIYATLKERGQPFQRNGSSR